MCLQVGHAEVSLGNKGVLAFALETKFEYDTNLNRNQDEDEDTIAVITPRLLYRYDMGSVYIDAFAGVQFRRYDEFTVYDAENIKTGVLIKYPNLEGDKNYTLEAGFGFNESTQADADLLQIVEKETLAANLNATYYFSDWYYGKGSVRIKDDTYQTQGFDDVRTVTAPFELYYRYSETLAFGLGYQVRDVKVYDVLDPADNVTHAYYFALDGQLTPTIDSKLKLGLQHQQFASSDFEDQTSSFIEAELGWEPYDRIRVALRGGNKLDTTALNQSIEKRYVQASLGYQYDEKLSFKFVTAYEESEYSTLLMESVRNDEEYFCSIESVYELIEDRLTLNGLIYYSDRSSDQAGSNYDRAFFVINLNLIY
jgi:hypothetical protein